MSVGLARLSLMFSRGLSFYLQVPRGQPIGWDNPSSNICPGQAERPVSLHFFFYLVLIRASQHFSFNECWPCAPPITHFQVFFYHRNLADKALMGTIPPQISMFTGLWKLYVPNLNQIIECWSYILLSVGHVRLSLAFSR